MRAEQKGTHTGELQREQKLTATKKNATACSDRHNHAREAGVVNIHTKRRHCRKTGNPVSPLLAPSTFLLALAP